MRAHKRKIDKVSIERANNYSKERIDSVLKKAELVKTDPDKKIRLSKNLCLCCYYINNVRIGGAAITDIECGICNKNMTFGSTAVDIICDDCSSSHNLCKHCGADIELKNRRKQYNF